MISLPTAQLQDSTPQQSLLFLQTVASDENFRRELESNPASALAQFGLSVNDMPENVILPSQEDLKASLDHMTADQGDKVEIIWFYCYQVPN